MMGIVSNCPLCSDKALHIIEEGGIGTQQCISCGYATTNKLIGTKEDNEMFKTLSEEMQGWSKEANDRIWIPTMFTLPFGTLYPTNVDGEMKWGFAEMVEIPKEEQKNYPIENAPDLPAAQKFHTRRFDTDNQKIFDIFLDAMVEMNKKAKADGPNTIQPQ